MKIKDLVKLGLGAITSTMLFSGCMGIQSTNTYSQNKNNLYLSQGTTIAYAHMKDGDKLDYITFKREKVKDGNEVILIKSNGYYPDYNMDADVEAGEKSPGCTVTNSEENENYNFCKSYYTERTTVSSGISILVNAAATFSTVGLNVASGMVYDPKFFNKDKFLKIVKDNNLNEIKAKIDELSSLEKRHNKELLNIYNTELNKYKENTKNISFKYNYSDKSRLFFGNKLVHQMKIDYLNPNKNLLSYDTYFNNKKFISSDELNSYFNDLINKLNSEFGKVENKYKNDHMRNSLTHYSFSIDNQTYFKLNDNVSYNGKLYLPKNLKYEYGVKKVVPVKVTIESANAFNITPKNFILSDKNLNINFTNQQKNSIDLMAQNNTTSFLTIKSLTSYLNTNVYTFSNSVNRELSPESRTLANNSSYSLFTNDMLSELNLNKIIKKDLENKIMKYGFAVKYHIQDNNIEKTIFNTKKYTYLELFKNLI